MVTVVQCQLNTCPILFSLSLTLPSIDEQMSGNGREVRESAIKRIHSSNGKRKQREREREREGE